MEHLYLPSRFSKRLDSSEIFEKHWQFCRNHTKLIKDQIPHELNISYGPGSREKIDIYGTDLGEGTSVLIHIHGGYYQEADVTHSDQGFIGKCLYKHKIKSIFVGYELCPTVTLNELMRNIQKAMEKCFEYAKNHKSRAIYLSGHSAGAHAVAMLFTNYIKNLPQNTQKQIKAAFMISGIYDLIPLLKTSINDPLQLNERTGKELSPMFLNIDGNSNSGGIKFYVVTAEHESPAFIQQSELFHQHLVDLKNDSSYVQIKDVDHFDIIEKLVDEEYKLTKLFTSIMSST